MDEIKEGRKADWVELERTALFNVKVHNKLILLFVRIKNTYLNFIYSLLPESLYSIQF